MITIYKIFWADIFAHIDAIMVLIFMCFEILKVIVIDE